MAVPRLGVESELQLPDYTTATATPDLSPVCDLHHSSQWRRILNPLSEARDKTHNIMVTSQIHFCCTTMRIPRLQYKNLSGKKKWASVTSFVKILNYTLWPFILESRNSICVCVCLCIYCCKIISEIKHKVITMIISTKQRTGWLGLGWEETSVCHFIPLDS